MSYAFQCKSCGRLVASADAGERDFPAACPSCGHGVSYDSVTGIKSFEDADNWEALADLSEAKKKKLVDDHDDDDLIEDHTPAKASGAEGGAHLSVVADETVGQEDEA